MRPNPATYPKTYATVTWTRRSSKIFVASHRFAFLAKTESGETIELSELWKSGSKSSLAIKIGAIVKIYQRPGQNHPNFRMLGD